MRVTSALILSYTHIHTRNAPDSACICLSSARSCEDQKERYETSPMSERGFSGLPTFSSCVDCVGVGVGL